MKLDKCLKCARTAVNAPGALGATQSRPPAPRRSHRAVKHVLNTLWQTTTTAFFTYHLIRGSHA